MTSNQKKPSVGWQQIHKYEKNSFSITRRLVLCHDGKSTDERTDIIDH